jgi:hypothetical protein
MRLHLKMCGINREKSENLISCSPISLDLSLLALPYVAGQQRRLDTLCQVHFYSSGAPLG